MPHVPGVRTVRKLLVGLGIGLAFITVFSVFALIYLFRLNAVVRHVAFDPVPGSAAIASVAKDFNQYRVLEAMGRRAAESWGMSLTRKAADIERDLKAYDATITQRDDRRRFYRIDRVVVELPRPAGRNGRSERTGASRRDGAHACAAGEGIRGDQRAVDDHDRLESARRRSLHRVG